MPDFGNTPQESSYLIRLILATRLVSTIRQAEFILIAIAVIAFLLTLHILFAGEPSVPSNFHSPTTNAG